MAIACGGGPSDSSKPDAAAEIEIALRQPSRLRTE
jgi:hypothetical protein